MDSSSCSSTSPLPESRVQDRSLSQLSALDQTVVDLLAEHRVLTTTQLVVASCSPERTIDYRLSRLLEIGLVARTRPYRDKGSAPYHWWLSAKGLKRMGEETTSRPPAEPNPLFLAHTTAVAGLWLALTRSPWLQLDSWLREEAAREEWRPRSAGWGRSLDSYKLTPDATAGLTIQVDGRPGRSAIFWEADLATMTQERLLGKLSRYRRYVEDHQWLGHHPHPPVLLMTTTSNARARRFIAGALRLQNKSKSGGWRQPGEPDPDRLVVAACGKLLEPHVAVNAPVWIHDPEAEPVALATLLSIAVRVRRRRAEWEVQEAARLEALEPRTAARVMCERHGPCGFIADEDAARILRVFIDSYRGSEIRDKDHWADEHAALLLVVWRWWEEQRTRQGLNQRPSPAPQSVIDAIKDYEPVLWQEQVRSVLSADQALEVRDPLLPVLASKLVAGELVSPDQLRQLHRRQLERARLELELLGDYYQQRDLKIEYQIRQMPYLKRRKAIPEQMAATQDREHLQACGQCGLLRRRTRPVHEGTYCQPCGGSYGPFENRAAPVDVHALLASLGAVLYDKEAADG